jgi:hypothetical protein
LLGDEAVALAQRLELGLRLVVDRTQAFDLPAQLRDALLDAGG